MVFLPSSKFRFFNSDPFFNVPVCARICACIYSKQGTGSMRIGYDPNILWLGTVVFSRTCSNTPTNLLKKTKIIPLLGLTHGRLKKLEQLLSRDRGCLLLRTFLLHVVTGQPDCSWQIQVWCVSTATGMHLSSWRRNWIDVELVIKVSNGTQSSQDWHIKIMKLFLVLAVCPLRCVLFLLNIYIHLTINSHKRKPDCS